jgi:hypothetical protein
MSTGGEELAILGVPSSGKTTYVAALVETLDSDHRYGMRVDFGESVKSKQYIMDRIDELRSGGTAATVRETATDISFKVVLRDSGRPLANVRTKDVSGEDIYDLFVNNYEPLFRAAHKSAGGMKAGTLRLLESPEFDDLNQSQRSLVQQIENTKKFILLVDPIHDKSDRSKQNRFVDSLIDILKVVHGENALREVPIALLFSKADIYPEVNKPVPFMLKYCRDFASKLMSYFPLLALYPISSVGGYMWHRMGDTKVMGLRKPKGSGTTVRLAPKNIVEPLLWFRNPTKGQLYLRKEKDRITTFWTPIRNNDYLPPPPDLDDLFD